MQKLQWTVPICENWGGVNCTLIIYYLLLEICSCLSEIWNFLRRLHFSTHDTAGKAIHEHDVEVLQSSKFCSVNNLSI